MSTRKIGFEGADEVRAAIASLLAITPDEPSAAEISFRAAYARPSAPRRDHDARK